MGTVNMAGRPGLSAAPLALKLIKAGMDSRQVWPASAPSDGLGPDGPPQISTRVLDAGGAYRPALSSS